MSEVLPGLTNLLQDFTVAALCRRPTDLVKFATEYFNNLSAEIEANSGSNHSLSDGTQSQSSRSSGLDESQWKTGHKVKQRVTTYARRKSVTSERYDPEADGDDEDDRVIYPKSDEQRARLGTACKQVLLFRALEEEQISELIDGMFERKVIPAEHIITEGEDGDNFYIIDQGTYDIFVDGKKYGSYNDSGSFGELALMYNQPRAATIVATSKGVLWAMDRAVFRRIVLKNAYNRRKMYEALIEGVPMFKSLNHYERMNVADAFVSKTFRDDECVIKQGDAASCMYFVVSGKARVMVRRSTSENEKELRQIAVGGFFGELALITNKPRAASVYAEGGPLKVAMLDVAAFERLLGPCMNIMKRNISTYEEEMSKAFGSKSMITNVH